MLSETKQKMTLQVSLFIFYGTSYLVNREETFPCNHTSNTSKHSSHWKKKNINPENSVTYNSSFYGKEKYQFVSCLSQHSTLLFLLISFPVHLFSSFSKSVMKSLLAAFWSSSASPWPVSSFSCHLTPPRVSLWWVVLYCLFTVLWLALFTKPQY